MFDLLVLLAALLVVDDRRNAEAQIASYRQQTAVQRYLCDSKRRELP